jgi:hypothetical protein
MCPHMRCVHRDVESDDCKEHSGSGFCELKRRLIRKKKAIKKSKDQRDT